MITCIINIVAIFGINTFILKEEQTRYIFTFDILDRIVQYVRLFNKSFLKSFNFILPYTNVVIVLLTIFMAIGKKIQKDKIYKYILFVIVSIIMSSYYILVTKVGPFLAPRMCMSMGAIIGFSFIFIINMLDIKETKTNIIMYLIICSFLVYNIFTYIVLSTNHIKANKEYLRVGEIIKKEVEQYEKNTNDTVKYYFIFSGVHNVTGYPKGILHLDSLTENPLMQSFCVKEYISIFAQRELEDYSETELYEKQGIQAFSKDIMFNGYEEFGVEQIEVNNSVIYIFL